MPLINCNKCPLYKDDDHIVKPQGDIETSQVLICAESPGIQEEETGIPLNPNAPAGGLFRTEAETIGIDWNDCVILNSTLCRPPDPNNSKKNRKPTEEEIECCRPNLDQVISHMPNLKLILNLGGTAFQRIEGSTLKPSKRRGYFIELLKLPGLAPGKSVQSFATWHPSYIRRNKTKHPEFVQDLEEFYRVYKDVVRGEETHETHETEGTSDYRILTEEKDVRKFLDRIERDDIKGIVVDIETTSKHVWKAKTLGIGFSWIEGTGVYIPLKHKPADEVVFFFSKELEIEIINRLKPFLEGKRNWRISGQNPKYDYAVLKREYDISMEIRFATDLAARQLLYLPSYNLESLVHHFFPALGGFKDTVKEYIADDGDGFENVPLSILGERCNKDCDFTLRLTNILAKGIQNGKL